MKQVPMLVMLAAVALLFVVEEVRIHRRDEMIAEAAGLLAEGRRLMMSTRPLLEECERRLSGERRT